MHFVYPTLLWALLLLAIPVIIHLFNFRRYKKVWFTNVRFLKHITEETTSRNKLKHWLVLLSRLLALASLVIAFAQPYIPTDGQVRNEASGLISVFIDNSFSMELPGKESRKLEEAKKAAAEVIKAFKPSDRFQVLTNDFEGSQQRMVNREEALARIDNIKISPAARTFSEVLSRQNQAAGSRFTSYLISDMQQWQVNLANLPEDSINNIVLIPIPGNKASNLSIDTCYFVEPFILKNKPATVKTVISNYGDKEVEQLTVRLLINGSQKALASISIPPQSSTETRLVFTTDFSGNATGEIQITDYPLVFDDRWFFTVTVNDKVNTLLLSPKAVNRYISTVYTSDSLFNLAYQNEQGIDYGSFRSYNAIVVSDFASISSGMSAELEKYLRSGGTVILFPDTQVNLDSYNDFFRQVGCDSWEPAVSTEMKADKLNFESEVLSGIFDLKNQRDRNIDYPLVKKFFRTVKKSTSVRESILTLQDGSPLLSHYSVGKGKLYLATQAASLASGNFVNHALFAPVLYRMALQSGIMNPPFQVIGAEGNYVITGTALQGDMVYKLSNLTTGMEVIPPTVISEGNSALNLRGIVNQAGFYNLLAGNQVINIISFNYNRQESSLTFLDESALRQAVSKSLFRNISVLQSTPSGYSAAIAAQATGRPLWKWFIAFVLLFLAAETVLLRWMK